MHKGFRGIQNKPYNQPGNVYVVKCPDCEAVDRQVKIGRMPSGSQRYKCKHCGRKYAPQAIRRVRPSGLVRP